MAYNYGVNYKLNPISLFYRFKRDLVNVRFNLNFFVYLLVIFYTLIASILWDVLHYKFMVLFNVFPACSVFTVPSHASCVSLKVIPLSF
jgi:hypothetical protein